jgi:PAS domain-containing protein
MLFLMEISADSYRIAIDGAGYGIFDLNVENGSLRCSGGLLTSLGYPPYKIIENIEDFESLISPIDIPRFREALQQQIRDYTPLNVDLRMLLKKGGSRWLSMKGGFQVSNTGSVCRLTAIIVDIDRYKSAELRIHKIAELLSSPDESQ